jgi:hypothetical protein
MDGLAAPVVRRFAALYEIVGGQTIEKAYYGRGFYPETSGQLRLRAVVASGKVDKRTPLRLAETQGS